MAICPRASLRIPTMRLRVVCGLAETMDTFCPRMRLSSVDLPAFGRPTKATTPKRGFPSLRRAERGVSGASAESFVIGLLRRFQSLRRAERGVSGESARSKFVAVPPEIPPLRSAQGRDKLTDLLNFLPFRIPRNLHPINAPPVGTVHFESVAVFRHHGSPFRHTTERCEDHPCHGLVILARKMRVEHLLERLHSKQAGDQILVVSEVDDGRFDVFVLVADVADDLFDDVFD